MSAPAVAAKAGTVDRDCQRRECVGFSSSSSGSSSATAPKRCLKGANQRQQSEAARSMRVWAARAPDLEVLRPPSSLTSGLPRGARTRGRLLLSGTPISMSPPSGAPLRVSLRRPKHFSIAHGGAVASEAALRCAHRSPASSNSSPASSSTGRRLPSRSDPNPLSIATTVAATCWQRESGQFESRPQRQRSCTFVRALCWFCITSGFTTLPASLNLVHAAGCEQRRHSRRGC